MGDSSAHLIKAVAWPVTMLLGLIMLSSIILIVTAFVVPGEAAHNISKILGEVHGITRLVALIVIVPLIGALAILERVSGEAAVAALSAIAGYTLGSTSGP
jgi:hypothetical protein